MLTLNTSVVMGTDAVHAETKTRDPSFVMPGHHCHSCCELFYVHKGECRFLIDDRIQDLRAGDFILIPPMALHYTRYVFGSCTRTVILFRREDVADDVLSCLPDSKAFLTETRVVQVLAGEQARVEKCLSQIVEEEKNDDPCSAPIRRCIFQGLLLLCRRICGFLPGAPSDIQTTDKQILEAARFISENYMHPLTTGDVAKEIGYSPNYLSRKFRLSAGIGLHEYIVFVRLHHAAQELISSSDSITSIALRCGFSDSNYFKDSFKKKYGVTPRNYRKIR